jgi:hypothetical protein
MGRPVRGPALLEPGESLHFPGSPFAAVGEPAAYFVPYIKGRAESVCPGGQDASIQNENGDKVALRSSEPPRTRTWLLESKSLTRKVRASFGTLQIWLI